VKAIQGSARIGAHRFTIIGAGLNAPAMKQTSLHVSATQTRVTLSAGGVDVDLDFLSPVDPNDLRRLSMPFGYLFARARSVDGKTHRVDLYFDISGEWAHGDVKAQIVWDKEHVASEGAPNPDGILALSMAPAEPKPLLEVNEYPAWGRAILATRDGWNVTSQIGPDSAVRLDSAKRGPLDGTVDTRMPRAIDDRWPVCALNVRMLSVGPRTPSPWQVYVIGHVREPAVSYLKKRVPPLWRSYWPTWQRMLAFAFSDAEAARRRADRLDARVQADAVRAGGPKYAQLCNLAFRQAFGGTELVGTADKPWLFLKEISSDGNISTVDVIYPAFPAFLYANPALVRLLADPILDYAENGGWPKSYSPHDIGSSYPNAFGHNNGNEEGMPVEESANMLVLAAVYIRFCPSSADASGWARAHYAVLKRWADYEVTNGLDPAYQNQTDDFTGFIKSSANLALKAIVGVGAMGRIAHAAGNEADSARYAKLARDMISKWTALARSRTGDHLVLAYGKDDTWSLKYNAYPDRVLGLDLIPREVLAMEARSYASHENRFGIPLDIRHSYTKTDWEMWTAGSTDDARLRQFFIDSIWDFANTSSFRGAFTDWYDTKSGRQVGFVARPVIGGVFALITRSMTPRR
jgi:hypothetical protein